MGPNTRDESTAVGIGRGVVAGLIAGAVASFVMDRVQAAVSALASSEGDEKSEPATEKAAVSIARHVFGQELSERHKPLAGQSVHYALGIGLGIVYAVAAEFRPGVTAGQGALFGIATATLLDEGVVPALGLGKAPWNAGISSNLTSYASHLVFGGTAELVRRQVAYTLSD